MPLILTHDLGTTSNKATMFDDQGRLVAHHVEPYPVDYPQAGWAKQDPLDWWRAVETSTRTLLAKAQVHSSDIAAVTLSGQMMGIVPIDAVGQPLRSAIIWADQRAVEEAETIGTRCGPEQKSIDAQVIASAPLTSRPKSCGSNNINPICIGRRRSSSAPKTSSHSNSPAGAPPIIPMRPAAIYSISRNAPGAQT